MTWWRDCIVYQIYPRSFQDSDADGVGDLAGITSRLDYLAWLGVDVLWLNPVTPSPNADWGYDVSNYTDIDPTLGSLEDLDRLVDEAGRRGIRIVLDIVPNHSSVEHRWFVDARESPESPYRDYYVWADGHSGGPPNNWVSVFSGGAWTLDAATEQYYLHNFLREQPDLNWWHEPVHAEFEAILRFWFDRGVAGFRIDVAHGLVKDRALRDNPPATEDDPPDVRRLGQRPVYNMHRPETHDILRAWRRVAESYDPPRLLLGETFVPDVATLASYYGANADELSLAFNFPFAQSELSTALRDIVEETEQRFGDVDWPVWTGSNHDIGRLATRWADGDERRVRAALTILLTLRGTPVLYYGDEIGLRDVELTREQLRDPVGIRFWPHSAGRDPCRTPMPWTSEPGGGFTSPGADPWLPLGDVAAGTVEDQRADPGSVLSYCRALIALRRERGDLRVGTYRSLPSPAGVWSWQRGDTTTVAVNLGREPADVPGLAGKVLLATDPSAVGQAFGRNDRLAPYAAVVLDRSAPR